jgi:hypothetical protein
MKDLNWLFDFSTLDKNHELYSTHNIGIAGKFKIEMENIQEVVALNSKCYSILRNPIIVKEKEEITFQKCKGVPKAFLQDRKHEYYNSILTDGVVGYVTSHHIRAKKQQLYTLTQTKKGFTALDLKRYYISSTETIAYGNKRIKILENGDLLTVSNEQQPQ